MIIVIAGLAILLVASIVMFVVFRCTNLVPGITIVKPLRKSVVVMHRNVLYSETNKDPNGFGVAQPMLPHVKIEHVRVWFAKKLTSASEYEIPLDKEWEFPREK